MSRSRLSLPFHTVAVVSVILFFEPAYAAPLDGDAELLLKTAAASEKAVTALHSWSGQADLTITGSIKGSLPYQQQTSVLFRCDCDHDSAEWKCTINERTGNDKADPRISCGIFHDNKVYEMQEYVADEPRPNALTIKVSARSAEPGAGLQRLYDQFSPMQYYPQMNLNTAKALRWYHEHQHDPGFTGGTIKDAGREIVLETVGADALNRFEFDKMYGCVLAHYLLKGGGVEERCDVTFGSINGVSVPTLYRYSHSTTPPGGGPAAEDLTVETKFLDSQVNQPLPMDAFTTDWLHPREGDLVNDTTLGMTYFYKASSTQPSAPSK